METLKAIMLKKTENKKENEESETMKIGIKNS